MCATRPSLNWAPEPTHSEVNQELITTDEFLDICFSFKPCQKSVKDLAGIYEGPSEETALLSCPLPHFILEVAQEFLEHFLQQHPSISQAQIHQNQSKKISFDSYTYGEMDAKSIQNHK